MRVSEHKHTLIVTAMVLISMGTLLFAFELGGAALAAGVHALCVGFAVRYYINEPQRIRLLVRARTMMLQDLAYRDGLTGMPNRRFFQWYLEQYLPRQVSGHAQERQLISVVLFDLNGFKFVNDTYGHDAGDALLKHLADAYTANLPEGVLVARLGGDEFVAVVRDDKQGKLLTNVVKILRQSSKTPLYYQHERIQVSASVGIASTIGQRPELADLLRRADKTMYADKAAQRRQKDRAPQRAMPDARLELQA